jgi:uncharacterized protein YbjT (DUF2867 family)
MGRKSSHTKSEWYGPCLQLTAGDSAKALVAKYPTIEIVKADLNDPESLRSGMKGAYDLFGVTDSWAQPDGDQNNETVQGRALVDAAKATGIKHWSTLGEAHAEPKVPHFVTKYETNGLTLSI